MVDHVRLDSKRGDASARFVRLCFDARSATTSMRVHSPVCRWFVVGEELREGPVPRNRVNQSRAMRAGSMPAKYPGGAP
jgi:hypothetical protein